MVIMLLSPSEGPGVDRELFRHPTPVNTEQNTHAPLCGPGLSGRTGGQHLHCSPPAAQARPPARLREPRVGPLGRVLSSLSPLPVPRLALPVPGTHDRCPARGSAAASACPSTARHCPAGGCRWALPPAACPGAPQSSPTAPSRLGSAARTQPPAPFWNLPGKTRDSLLNQRGGLLLQAPGGLR